MSRSVAEIFTVLTQRLSLLGGEGTEDDLLQSVHHCHGVETHVVGVGAADAYPLVSSIRQIFDQDVFVPDGKVSFAAFAVDLG